jgi:hypothetical protein
MSRTIRNNEDLFWNEKFYGRDKKSGQKPPSYFKKFRRQVRRAKEHNALKHLDIEEVNIPIFKKSDEWEWD